MAVSEIEAEWLRTEKDIEKKKHQELEDLIEENLVHERNAWPGFKAEDHSPFHLFFFLINLIILPTGFTFFLEHLEMCDELICRRYIQEKARQVFQAMGSKNTKQEPKDSKVENMVGTENSNSLLDFRNWHTSSIGILIILVLLVLGALWCAHKHYLCLHQEVQHHRANHHKLVRETGQQVEVVHSDDWLPIGKFPVSSRTDTTVINSESLHCLCAAAAAQGNQPEVD